GLTRKTHNTLDDMLLKVIRRPIMAFFFLAGLSIALPQLSFLPSVWLSLAGNAVYAGFIAIGYVLSYRLISELTGWYAANMAQQTETSLDDQFIPFFRRLLLLTLTAIVSIMLIQYFGYDITAFVATLGIGSLAVALAAQSTFSDMINGFIIIVDRPFRIGDRIELRDLNTWGDVVDIGLRSTRILTRDNRMVIVPNTAIGKSLVVNHSYPDTQYRVQTAVGLAYGTDIEAARQVMIEAVRSQDWVMKEKPIEALFLEFGDSALVFRVRCWIKSYVDTRRVLDKLNTSLYHALNEAGIEIPFPQQTLWHRLETEAKQDWRDVLHE
ncbi:MAG: mechanosensitive ion channel family protein, partial [Chloroflexi bacterium]|nr:mechanosensitive ion channel family protein [Chloroflexota bacterium]